MCIEVTAMTDTERIAFLSELAKRTTIEILHYRTGECGSDEVWITLCSGTKATGEDLASAIDTLAAVMERKDLER